MSTPSDGARMAVMFAALASALAFLASASPSLALAAIILGSLWLAGSIRGWAWVTNTGLFLAMTLCVVASLRNAPLLPSLLAAAFALAAWDLDRYARWTARLEVPRGLQMEQAHLIRLAAALILGVALGMFAWVVRLSLSFLWALALGSIAVYGLYRSFILWRREPDE